MDRGPARAGFLGPGRIILGAHFGRVDGDPLSAHGPLSKTIPKVPVSGPPIRVFNTQYFSEMGAPRLKQA